MGLRSQPILADRTASYVLQCRPLHDLLTRILTQAAGYSLLVMSRAGRLPLLDAPVALAREALREVPCELQLLQVPSEARHHHQHVVAASEAVGRALDLLWACLRRDADEARRAALVRCLRLATDHLRAATRLLPGFAMADLTQACCAVHSAGRELVCR